MTEVWDAIIVGAGPAGLNAALVLGRCRRTVLVIDDERPRNACSRALHGFLTRDGIAPAQLRRIAREQLTPYASVRLLRATVADAGQATEGFCVSTTAGDRFLARKLLLAAGVKDDLPDLRGFQALYGRCVFHCPYCDGWEVRDGALAVYGRGDDKGAGLALELLQWSADVVLCTDGPAQLSETARQRLARWNIGVCEERIACLDAGAQVDPTTGFEIVFDGRPRRRVRALFFNTGRRQSTDLALRLGCEMYEETGCKVDNTRQAAGVPGLYVAGDASRDVLQAVVAAAEGAEAAIAINTALIREQFL